MIDDPDAKQQLDPLYILDSTNPGAQQYLHTTYSTLAKDWGIRYIKLDFMDDSAIEGNYYRPNTTALRGPADRPPSHSRRGGGGCASR